MRRSLSFKLSVKEPSSKEELRQTKPKKIDADGWLRENSKPKKNNIKEGPPKNLRYEKANICIREYMHFISSLIKEVKKM